MSLTKKVKVKTIVSLFFPENPDMYYSMVEIDDSCWANIITEELKLYLKSLKLSQLDKRKIKTIKFDLYAFLFFNRADFCLPVVESRLLQYSTEAQ